LTAGVPVRNTYVAGPERGRELRCGSQRSSLPELGRHIGRRLADEHDAAQARGEEATGQPETLGDGKSSRATAANLGLRHSQINHASLIRAVDFADLGFWLPSAERPHVICNDLIAALQWLHAHALEIEAAAKPRLAYDYNAAQARGEVASSGQRGPTKAVDDSNSFSSATAIG